MGSLLGLKDAVLLALVAVSGFTGWLAVDQWRDRLRAEGRAEIYAQRADSIRGELAAVRIRMETIDQVATSRILQAEAARDSAEERAARAASRRPEIVERIVQAPDTAAVRAAVQELEHAHEEEVKELRSALALSDSIISAQRGQLLVRDERLLAQDGLIASLEAQLGNTRQAGFFERQVPRAVAFVAGVGIGYLARSR